MTTMRSVTLVLVSLMLVGCGSIPLATKWKMYRMGPEGVLESNPAEIRAAVLSDAWFLDGENFDAGRLNLEMRRADDSMESFAFVLQSVSGEEYSGFDEPGPGQRWRVYAIERDELEAFQSMQRQLAGWLETDEFKGGSMSVAVKFDRGAEEEADSVEPGNDSSGESSDDTQSYPDEVRFRIDLRLREDEGYFTLIREHTMPVGDSSASGDRLEDDELE